MKTNLQTSTDQYAPIATIALSAMENVVIAGMELIKGDWKGALGNMSDALNAFWSAIQEATSAAFTALEDAFTAAANAIEGILTGAIGVMEGAWGGFIAFIQQGLGQLSGSLGSAQSR